MDLVKEILGLSTGRLALALSLADRDASTAGLPRDLPSVFRWLSAVALVQMTDPNKARELLSRAERVMVASNLEVQTQELGENKIYSVAREGWPLVSWSLAKGCLVVATGNMLNKTVTLMTKKGANVLSQVSNARAKDMLQHREGVTFFLNVAKAVDTLRQANLPLDLRAMLQNLLSTMEKISDVLLHLEVHKQGIGAELAIGLR